MMTRRLAAQRLIQFGLFALLIGAWHFVNTAGLVHAFLLPPLSAVVDAFIAIMVSGAFWPDLRVTLLEFASAYSIAASCGLFVGFLISRSGYSVRVFDPVLSSIY